MNPSSNNNPNNPNSDNHNPNNPNPSNNPWDLNQAEQDPEYALRQMEEHLRVQRMIRNNEISTFSLHTIVNSQLQLEPDESSASAMQQPIQYNASAQWAPVQQDRSLNHQWAPPEQPGFNTQQQYGQPVQPQQFMQPQPVQQFMQQPEQQTGFNGQQWQQNSMQPGFNPQPAYNPQQQFIQQQPAQPWQQPHAQPNPYQAPNMQQPNAQPWQQQPAQPWQYVPQTGFNSQQQPAQPWSPPAQETNHPQPDPDPDEEDDIPQPQPDSDSESDREEVKEQQLVGEKQPHSDLDSDDGLSESVIKKYFEDINKQGDEALANWVQEENLRPATFYDNPNKVVTLTDAIPKEGEMIKVGGTDIPRNLQAMYSVKGLAKHLIPHNTPQNLENAIEKLVQEGLVGFQNIRGDGNCFYNAFMSNYIMQIIRHNDGLRIEHLLDSYQNNSDAIKKIYPAAISREKFEAKLTNIMSFYNAMRDDDVFYKSVIAFSRAQIVKLAKDFSWITINGLPVKDIIEIELSDDTKEFTDEFKDISELGKETSGQHFQNILASFFKVDFTNNLIVSKTVNSGNDRLFHINSQLMKAEELPHIYKLGPKTDETYKIDILLHDGHYRTLHRANMLDNLNLDLPIGVEEASYAQEHFEERKSYHEERKSDHEERKSDDSFQSAEEEIDTSSSLTAQELFNRIKSYTAQTETMETVKEDFYDLMKLNLEEFNALVKMVTDAYNQTVKVEKLEQKRAELRNIEMDAAKSDEDAAKSDEDAAKISDDDAKEHQRIALELCRIEHELKNMKKLYAESFIFGFIIKNLQALDLDQKTQLDDQLDKKVADTMILSYVQGDEEFLTYLFYLQKVQRNDLIRERLDEITKNLKEVDGMHAEADRNKSIFTSISESLNTMMFGESQDRIDQKEDCFLNVFSLGLDDELDRQLKELYYDHEAPFTKLYAIDSFRTSKLEKLISNNKDFFNQLFEKFSADRVEKINNISDHNYPPDAITDVIFEKNIQSLVHTQKVNFNINFGLYMKIINDDPMLSGNGDDGMSFYEVEYNVDTAKKSISVIKSSEVLSDKLLKSGDSYSVFAVEKDLDPTQYHAVALIKHNGKINIIDPMNELESPVTQNLYAIVKELQSQFDEVDLIFTGQQPCNESTCADITLHNLAAIMDANSHYLPEDKRSHYDDPLTGIGQFIDGIFKNDSAQDSESPKKASYNVYYDKSAVALDTKLHAQINYFMHTGEVVGETLIRAINAGTVAIDVVFEDGYFTSYNPIMMSIDCPYQVDQSSQHTFNFFTDYSL